MSTSKKTFDWKKLPAIKNKATAHKALRQVVAHFGSWHWEENPAKSKQCESKNGKQVCRRQFGVADAPKVAKLLNTARKYMDRDDNEIYEIMVRPQRDAGYRGDAYYTDSSSPGYAKPPRIY